MKLWEAMLEGYKKVGRQHFSGYADRYSEPEAVCALGAVRMGLYGSPICVDDLFHAIYPLEIQRCPQCSIHGRFRDIIAHLNDTHKLTIPEIAAWVRQQEEGIAAKEPELQEVAK